MPNLHEQQIHLGLGATAEPQPPFTGMEWYVDYSERVASDGDEGRLVSMHHFTGPWDHWEVHPTGSEVVLCVDGEMTVIQEVDGREVETTLGAGDYVINEPGTWHTADVATAATGLFITSGRNTEHRPR
jgi:quercetin dioxygenase-like cupin family protein